MEEVYRLKTTTTKQQDFDMYCLDPWSHLLLFLQSSVGILGVVDAFENSSWVAHFYWFLFCFVLFVFGNRVGRIVVAGMTQPDAMKWSLYF